MLTVANSMVLSLSVLLGLAPLLPRPAHLGCSPAGALPTLSFLMLLGTLCEVGVADELAQKR